MPLALNRRKKKSTTKKRRGKPMPTDTVDPDYKNPPLDIEPDDEPKSSAGTKKKTTKKASTKKKATTKKASKKKTTAKSKAPKKALSHPADIWVAEQNKSKKNVGMVQVQHARDVRTPYLLRRSTGVLSLDIDLGGGWHAGGACELHGAESCGKTFLTFHTAGELQRAYGEDASILIYSTEIKPDKGFARMAGMCIAYSDAEIAEYNQLRIDDGENPFTKEEIADLKMEVGRVVVLTAANAEIGFERLVDALRSKAFHLIIIDSLGALLTAMQEEKDVGERTIAGPSMAVTHFANKTYPIFMMEGSETTVLGINQARARIAAKKYEKKTQAAMGAYAWKHSCLASVLLEQSSGIKEKEKGPTIGRVVRYEFTKGKAGTRDGLKGHYDFYHVPKMEPVFWADVCETWYGGISIYNDMAETAKRLGVVETAGAWTYWNAPDGEEYKFNGWSKFAQALADEPEWAAVLKKQCLRKAGIRVRYR